MAQIKTNLQYGTTGTIPTANIADDAITSAKLADDSVVAAAIADNAVVTAGINADAITDAKIADDVIGTEHLTAGEVDQTAIADQAINEAKMQISNAPTNGQMLTAQSGNTGGLTWAAAPTSTWVDCGSLAITSDTEVFLVDGSGGVTLDNTYDVYYMSLAGFDTGQRDSDYIRMTFSADGGSNYNIECHKIGVKSRINNTGTANESTAVYASQAGPTQIIFPDTAPEQNTNTAFGEFWFYNFGNTSKYKTCFFRTSWWSASEYLETITGTLYIESTSAIDAIRLAADHGTMRTGNLRLYGLSN